MQFLLLSLGTGGQKLSARCQPRSRPYQSATGMKGFIPADTHLGRGVSSQTNSFVLSGRVLSCPGPVTADRCQGLFDSTNPVYAEQVGAAEEA